LASFFTSVDDMSATTKIPPAPRTRRRGFSFVEVLFAVMILGIGFIMIAGVFPVAIAQTAATQEETIGAATARGAAATCATATSLRALIPNDGMVHRLTDDAIGGYQPWSLIKGNQILPDNTRFGWVAMIKRDREDNFHQPPGYAQVIVVPVQVRGRSGFNPAVNDLKQFGTDLLPGATDKKATAYGTLMPFHIRVTLTEGSNNPGMNFADRCVIDPNEGFPNAAATGAVVVLAGGNNPIQTDAAGRDIAGRIYRLGNPVPNLTNTWELMPGNDMAIDYGADGKTGGGDDKEETTSGPVDAWIVGQGLNYAVPGSFEGGNMAIGAYTSYIPLK
jgi:prepilin-type N-terminal cleavage/methylation domain-containing protein